MTCLDSQLHDLGDNHLSPCYLLLSNCFPLRKGGNHIFCDDFLKQGDKKMSRVPMVATIPIHDLKKIYILCLRRLGPYFNADTESIYRFVPLSSKIVRYTNQPM